MRDVFSDTSPLLYLHRVGELDLLRSLFGHVVVPQAVIRELEVGKRLGKDVPEPLGLPWITAREPGPESLGRVHGELGAGERATIALGLESPGSLLLLDDLAARGSAEELGCNFTGTLGVLLKAKSVGLLAFVGPIIDRLEQRGFRLDEGTRSAVLRLASE